MGRVRVDICSFIIYIHVSIQPESDMRPYEPDHTLELNTKLADKSWKIWPI